MFPLYRNQSIDLRRKSIHWFLYDEKVGLKQVNILIRIRMVFFGVVHNLVGVGGSKNGPIPKTWDTYPTIIKRDTAIPYLDMDQKIYKTHNTLLEFC